MTILDAYALVALLHDEPAAPTVRDLLREGDAAIPSVNLAEAVDIAERTRGVPREVIRALVSGLTSSVLEVYSLGESVAWRAAELRATHYHRVRCDVSIADCLLVACASGDDAIATADAAVLRVARAEEIAVIALEDSQGRKPR